MRPARPEEYAAVGELTARAYLDDGLVPDGSDYDETLRRAEAYLRAGADGVFVPGLADEDRIAGLAADLAALDAPLNILIAPGLTVARLADLGVRRVSCGSLLFRAALRAAVDTAWALAHPDAEPGPLPSYAEAQALADRFS